MAIGKPRGKNGMRPVFEHVPKGADPDYLQSIGLTDDQITRAGQKIYVGSRKALRGTGGAQDLEREWIDRLQGKPGQTVVGDMTCDQYAARWLTAKHGPGTRRPSPQTETVNRSLLKAFRSEFGARLIDGDISREEALDWCKQHPLNAKSVSAMFNDAIDDGRATANPFANRRLPEARGRRDIEPLTEDEIEKLAQIAVVAGAHGLVVAGWIKFLAWVGCRPGEAATRQWDDLDLDAGRVRIPRIKGDKQTDTVVLPPTATQSLLAMPGPRTGLLFRTAQGHRYDTDSFGYYWRPVRLAFKTHLESHSPARLAELTRVRGALDVYALRHFCGSLMADRGLSEHDIAHQLGNSVEVCRRTYIHTHRDRANERVADALSSNVVDLTARRKGA